MIELKMTGMCEGCMYGEITVDRIVLYENDIEHLFDYIVRCEHQDACRRAKEVDRHE